MRPATIELMHEQVRAIYRAATGAELSDGDPALEAEQVPLLDSEVARRFVELETLARQNPAIGQRVPPFSFTPLINLLDAGSDLVIEVAAPGVLPGDVEVEATQHELAIHGTRRAARIANAAGYLHAEIPYGPFSRTIRLPCAVQAQVQFEVQSGLISIRLHKALTEVEGARVRNITTEKGSHHDGSNGYERRATSQSGDPDGGEDAFRSADR